MSIFKYHNGLCKYDGIVISEVTCSAKAVGKTVRFVLQASSSGASSIVS